MRDDVLETHLQGAEADALDHLSTSNLSAEEEVQVLTLRGLNIERETYQSLSDAGLLPPIATRSLMYEIDDEIEEAEHGALRVEAARRGHLPWYARFHRMILGRLPPPMGEDLTEVGYIEISARRLAAQRAAAELGNFDRLPNIDREKTREAMRTFTDWADAAESRLETLEREADIAHLPLHRRQAQALARISVREVMRDLVAAGVVSAGVAEDGAVRILSELEADKG